MFRIIRGLLVLSIFLGCFPAFSQISGATYTYTFAQFADGHLPDGSYYRSTLIVLPWGQPTTSNCVLRLFGMTTSFDGGLVDSQFSFAIASYESSGMVIKKTDGVQTFQNGYAQLACDTNQINGYVLYSFYAADGTKLSEATVFAASTPYFTWRLSIDQREGARLGVAVANVTDSLVTSQWSVTGAFGTRTGSVTIPPRQTVAKFVSEVISDLPTDAVGVLKVQLCSGFSSAGNCLTQVSNSIAVIGLRYTGATFTTIPAANP